jgi:CHAT domain-containing protein
LLAVVVCGGRATLHELGETGAALRQLTLVRFALHRLATLPERLLAASGARAAASHAADQLDRQCLAPLRPRLGDRPLVLVPTGALNALPWWLLPSCRGRPVTVAPSATVWRRAAAPAAEVAMPGGTPVLAAGPRLPAAPPEIKALAQDLPGARVLLGEDATAEAVTAAMDGAPLAHLAAHGTFRADNPLFSALELAGGPLTVYDLERLRRPPGRIVLSACDSGLSAVRPGDELMGLAAALLAQGTRTLVATVAPVPTDATTGLMLDLHRRMRAGAPPAAALAAAQERYVDGGDDRSFAASAGFVCFGAG